jgi:hypothetical protein
MNGKMLFLLIGASLFSEPVAAKGRVLVLHSDFDQSTEVSIDPHGAECGFRMTGILVGGFWNSKRPDVVMLKLATVNRYASLQSAALSIDGSIVRLDKAGVNQHENALGVSQTSTGTFQMSFVDFDRLVKAKKSMVRLYAATDFDECYIRTEKKPKGSLAQYAISALHAEVLKQKTGTNLVAP